MTPLFAIVVAGLVRPSALPDVKALRPTMHMSPKVAATAFAVQVAPLAAFAEEVMQNEDIDYGSVSAPNFILPLGAVLAILTALLPIFLRAGDDAAREMQQRDSGTFGKEFADSLKRDKK
mmetsp:Transcript_25948/g.70169  ORF Transcript_25948/g.70169 Transcript_25948/m.70169 type:complete len:120 (-) Transcript_25948:695-1054(-)